MTDKPKFAALKPGMKIRMIRSVESDTPSVHCHPADPALCKKSTCSICDFLKRDHVCAECGREGPEKNGPCINCGSYRIVSIEFAEATFGENWRDTFKERKE